MQWSEIFNYQSVKFIRITLVLIKAYRILQYYSLQAFIIFFRITIIIEMNHTHPVIQKPGKMTSQGLNNFAKSAKLNPKISHRKSTPQIVHGSHQKKREGPPGKKEHNKEGTFQHRVPSIKQENSLKNEDNTKNNTPPQFKHNQFVKEKENDLECTPNEYHLVSHSQRDNFFMSCIGAHMANQGALKDSRLRPRINSGIDSLRLAQQNQNDQTIKDSEKYPHRFLPLDNKADPQPINNLVNITCQNQS